MPERQLKYQKIKSFLLEELSSGRFAVGDHFYGDTDLAARFSVSQFTVRKAFASMEADGYLERRPGAGTHILQLPSCPQRIVMTNRCAVGLVCKDLPGPDNLVMYRMLATISFALEEAGYWPLLVCRDLSALQEAKVSGVILLGYIEQKQRMELMQMGFPVVYVGDYFADMIGVHSDPQKIAETVVKFFFQRGIRSFIQSGYRRDIMRKAEEQRNALATAAAAYGMEHIYAVTPREEDNIILLRNALQRHTKPEAILVNSFACLDPIMKLTDELHLKIGEDISLLVQGSGAMVQPTIPPMSIVDWDTMDMARLSVKLLCEMIRNPNEVHHSCKCGSYIITDRGSIAKRIKR